jgi:hypothetical protein
MSHFAQIDENNIVINVLVGDNSDPNGDEGYQWFVDTFGGRWIKTSYNGNIRKNYAGQGFYYDEQRDAFIPPKPFDTWILNEETCRWDPPIPYPTDGQFYSWNNDSLNWDLIKDPLVYN